MDMTVQIMEYPVRSGEGDVEYREVHQNQITSGALFFGAVLCALQAADGVLTSLGVRKFGIHVEANPVVRELIVSLGDVTALGLIKLLAIIVICFLVVLSRRVLWIRSAMGALSCVYLFGAVVPWIYLLFF